MHSYFDILNTTHLIVCDPVMGDDGQLYRSVPMEMVELYKKEVLPFADVLFPNQTEAEYA